MTAKEFIKYWDKYKDNVAIVDDIGSYSYNDLSEFVKCLCTRIKRIKPMQKSRFVIKMPNGMQAIGAFFAIISSNMIAVPISDQTPNALFSSLGEIVKANYIIELKNNRIAISTINSAANYTEHYYDSVDVILFSSGTTGIPKAVALSEESVFGCASRVAEYMKSESFDKYFVMKDYVHCSSLFGEIITALFCGASVCLFNPRAPISLTIKKIERAKPTVLGVNPFLLNLFCTYTKQASSFNSIRIVVTSGSLVDIDIIHKAKNVFRNASIINVYGMTEAGCRISAQFPGEEQTDVSVGKLLPGVQIRIDNPDCNGIGRLYVKSPNNMLFYVNDMNETHRVLDSYGWLFTGDLGRYNEENDNLYLYGRCDDIINFGGNKIDPIKVKNALEKHVSILEAYVFGLMNNDNSEIVAAIIRCKDNFNNDLYKKIIRHCARYLMSYEIPIIIKNVREIPRNSNGKISKLLAQQLVREE